MEAVSQVETISQRAYLERSLPGDYYRSRQIFELEKERIFFREWFCCGRAEELPEPGDYLLLEVAGESILVVRDRDGRINAFYNVCAHRGCQLTGAATPKPARGEGLGPTDHFPGVIRCPYHSWTYNLTGDLRSGPFLREGAGFTKGEFFLAPVEVDTWGGFIFLRLARPEGPDARRTVRDQLGIITEKLRRYPLHDLRTARRLVYEVEANWKVVMENYNECYHCGGVHPELCELVPAFRQNGGSGLDWDNGIPHREGAFTFTFSGTSNRAPFPGLDELEQTRHKGQLVYPNLLISLSAEHVAAFTLWPRDPDHTTVICDFLFHPTEMAKDDFDPSDAVEFWDVVNRQDWTICAGVQRGMHSRTFQYGYYAPMEDGSLDIRRYIAERLGTPQSS